MGVAVMVVVAVVVVVVVVMVFATEGTERNRAFSLPNRPPQLLNPHTRALQPRPRPPTLLPPKPMPRATTAPPSTTMAGLLWVLHEVHDVRVPDENSSASLPFTVTDERTRLHQLTALLTISSYDSCSTHASSLQCALQTKKQNKTHTEIHHQ
jgi:hypothetical protein